MCKIQNYSESISAIFNTAEICKYDPASNVSQMLRSDPRMEG